MKEQIRSLIIVSGITLLLSGCGGESVRTTDNNSNTKNNLSINADNYVDIARHFQQKQIRHNSRKTSRDAKQSRSYPGKSRSNQYRENSFALSSSQPFDGKFDQYTVRYNNSKTITQIDEKQDSVRISYFVNDTKQNETTMNIKEFQDLQGER